MKKLSSLVLLLSIICIAANASHSAQYWAKTYGGSEIDSAKPIQQTEDGGYIVAGIIIAASFDTWILKLDNNGDISWQRKYGGVYGGMSMPNFIQQTEDGGYVVAGQTNSFGAGNYDAWVFKLDNNGDITWQKAYGESGRDHASSIHQTSDGGYIVAGYTDSFGAGSYDFWVLKLDSIGDVIWQKAYGGSHYELARSLQQTSDGGYIVAGFISTDIQILKLDDAGNILWKKKYGWSDGIDAYEIHQTSDGGYIVAGEVRTVDYIGNVTYDILVLKLDDAGNIIWQKTYGGNSYDYAYSIRQTSDGGYIVAGYTNSFGAEDVWVLKLAINGDIAWQKTYGGSESDIARSIHQTEDGGYIVAGHTMSFGAGYDDVWVLKLDNNGEISDCSVSGSSSAIVNDTSIIPQDTSVTIQLTDAIVTDTSVIPQETSAETGIVCSSDIDEDGIQNSEDNCPEAPNGPDLGTCTEGDSHKIARPCLDNSECGTGGFCSMNQEDTDEDGEGDACDICEGDLNCDENCDAIDVEIFLEHFARNQYNNPCTNENQCRGDFNCDTNVDAADVTVFLKDFGRSENNNPCPDCVPGDWCVY